MDNKRETMKLEEEFRMFFKAYGHKDVSEHYAKQCVEISNAHTIAFANWIYENNWERASFKGDYNGLVNDKLEEKTITELLKIFNETYTQEQ